MNQHVGNFGDDAAGLALLQLLLKSNVQEIVVIHNGQYAHPLIDDPRINAPRGVTLREIGYCGIAAYMLMPTKWALRLNARLRNLIEIIRGVDLVIMAPSGANLGIYRDWQFLLRAVICTREGHEPIFFWNTVGSSGNRFFDSIAKMVFQRSKMYVREAASREYLEKRQIRSTLGFDSAFALASIPAQTRRIMTVVPAELDSWHPHFRREKINSTIIESVPNALAEIAEAHCLRIEILPHLRSHDEREFNNLFAQKLIHCGLPSEAVSIRNDISDVETYDMAIASSYVVIAGRYHAAVLAAKNGRAFVSLAYENKMIEVCRYLNTPELAIDLRAAQEAVKVSPSALTAEMSKTINICLANKRQLETHLAEQVSGSLEPRVTLPLLEAGLLSHA